MVSSDRLERPFNGPKPFVLPLDDKELAGAPELESETSVLETEMIANFTTLPLVDLRRIELRSKG